jgi:hypothetical protein
MFEENKKEKQKKDDDNPLPSHDQVRHSILAILYKEAEASPNNREVRREEVIEILNIPDNMVDFNIRYLVRENLIKTETTMESWVWAEITSSGINAIEHKKENKNRFSFLTAKIPIQIEAKIGIINF